MFNFLRKKIPLWSHCKVWYYYPEDREKVVFVKEGWFGKKEINRLEARGFTVEVEEVRVQHRRPKPLKLEKAIF